MTNEAITRIHQARVHQNEMVLSFFVDLWFSENAVDREQWPYHIRITPSGNDQITDGNDQTIGEYHVVQRQNGSTTYVLDWIRAFDDLEQIDQFVMAKIQEEI